MTGPDGNGKRKYLSMNRYSGLFMAFSCLLPGFSVAEADGPDFYRVVGVPKGDVLSLRSAPNARADKIGFLRVVLVFATLAVRAA
jgi:hypothetical protein